VVSLNGFSQGFVLNLTIVSYEVNVTSLLHFNWPSAIPLTMKETKTMKIKSHLTLATLIVAGMFATGCQQLSQQTAGAGQQQTAAPTETKKDDVKQPVATGNAHTHPAVPACTNSITHSHPFTDPNHTHHYSCKPGVAHKGAGPAVPHVKAKGNYKGPVAMDKASQSALKQYQQK
jgi:hypothetical protein